MRKPTKGSEESEPRRKLRESRAYIHERCGGETEISGYDFTRVANPFSLVSQTPCSCCGSWVTLWGVSWADTGEPITAYRRRLRRQAPLKVKLVAWALSPMLGALIGAPIAWFFDEHTLSAAGAAGVIGALSALAFFPPILIRWLCRIDYRNKR